MITEKNLRLIIITFVILLIFFYAVSFFGYNIAMRNKNYDYYTILGLTKAAENCLINKCENFNYFPNALINSAHTSFITLYLAIIKSFLKIDLITLSFIFGVFNIIFFYFALYYFLGFFRISIRKRLIIILLFFLICAFDINYQTLGTGLINLAGLSIGASSLQAIAYSLLFILLRISFSYIKKADKKNLILVSILSLSLISLHLYIFFMYLILAFIFSLVTIFQNRVIKKEIIYLAIILIGIILIYEFTWPFFNLIYDTYKSILQFQKGSIAQGSKDYPQNDPMYYVKTLSFSLLGLIFLFKEKDKFLKSWTISIILLIILFLLPVPFKLIMTWRFLFLLNLVLIIMISKNINLNRISSLNYIFPIFISLFVLINVLNASNVFTLSLKKNRPNDYLLYQQLASMKLDKGIILSDDCTSNLIQSVNNYSVFFIQEGHISNPELIIKNNERIKNTRLILLKNNVTELDNFLKKNKIDYILVNKKFNSELANLLKKAVFINYKMIYNDEYITIHKVH